MAGDGWGWLEPVSGPVVSREFVEALGLNWLSVKITTSISIPELYFLKRRAAGCDLVTRWI